jgi:hypothetical protein
VVLKKDGKDQWDRSNKKMKMYYKASRRKRTIKIKTNWIGHLLRRNCLLKHVTEGKLQGQIDVKGRQGRRRKQLLDDLKEKQGYWKLKEEALDRTLWRTRFGRDYGPVVRQTTE